MGRLWGEIDAFIKQSQKDLIKTRFQQAILYDHQKEFKWKWPYYFNFVDKLFKDLEIFRSSSKSQLGLTKEYERIYAHINKIRETYSKDFDEIEDTVIEYGGMSFSGSIMI